MTHLKDRRQPKLYRLILVKIWNFCKPWLLGDSLPPHSVYAETFVLSCSPVNPDHLLPWAFVCPWCSFLSSTNRNLDSQVTVTLKYIFPLSLSQSSFSSVQFSSVQLLSCVWLFATPWITAHQASLSITNSQSSLRLMSIESVMPSSHLILCRPLLLRPPIPPSIRVLIKSWELE